MLLWYKQQHDDKKRLATHGMYVHSYRTYAHLRTTTDNRHRYCTLVHIANRTLGTQAQRQQPNGNFLISIRTLGTRSTPPHQSNSNVFVSDQTSGTRLLVQPAKQRRNRTVGTRLTPPSASQPATSSYPIRLWSLDLHLVTSNSNVLISDRTVGTRSAIHQPEEQQHSHIRSDFGT
jgi:hypothetical protein